MDAIGRFYCNNDQMVLHIESDGHHVVIGWLNEGETLAQWIERGAK